MKLNEMKQILADNDIKLSRFSGQNFLADQNILAKIIRAANIKKTDNVLEVGPGLGVLTNEIAVRAKKVVAVEKDKKIFGVLRSRRSGAPVKTCPIAIINQDILKVPFSELAGEFEGQAYRVIANLPYSITGNFLRRFLEADYHPTEMILMLQREVGKRMVARPPDMSLLGVMAQFFSEAKILFRVSSGCFYPRPKVESVIIRLGEIGRNRGIDPSAFVPLVKAGFRAKRKQLRSNLLREKFGTASAIDNAFSRCQLKPTVRAEELSVEKWIELARELAR